MSQRQSDDLNLTITELRKSSQKHKETSWLRHKGQAGLIDCMLIKGATIAEMVQAIRDGGLNQNKKTVDSLKSRVKRHLAHLTTEEHGLAVEQDERGKWKFSIPKE